MKLGHLKQDRAYGPRLRLSVSQYEHIIFYFQALSKFHGDPNKNTTCNHSCHTMIVEVNNMHIVPGGTDRSKGGSSEI